MGQGDAVPQKAIRPWQFLDGSFCRDKDDGGFFFENHLKGSCPFCHNLFIACIDFTMDESKRIKFTHGLIRIERGQFTAQKTHVFPSRGQDDQRI